MISIVDSGPLFAAADEAQPQHQRCFELLSRTDLQLVVPALVVTEVAYFIGSRLGPDAEARFVDGIAALEVESPRADEWPRIAELLREYRDFPLGTVDASVIALAERLDTPTVITLDHRHFATVRPRHCEALRLLP